MTTPSLNPWPWETLPPGVYFDLPFADYLAQPCIQSSGIKSLLVSGPNFWAESWMNPFRRRKDSKAFAEGRPYHCRILEGAEAFQANYAPLFEFDDSDPSVLTTDTKVTARLRDLGVKGYSTTDAAGRAKMLLEADPAAKILSAMREAHTAQYPGREFLHPDIIREIELAAAAIKANPHIAPWLAGGYPEVSIIYDDPELGVRVKVRFDYLKIGAGADLKTVANEKGRDFEKAVDYAIAGYRYIIQPALYLRAADAAAGLIRAGAVYGDKIPPQDWLDAFASTPVDEFRFIFQQKGAALCTEGRIYSRLNTELCAQGEARIQKGVARFKDYYSRFGDAPWFSMNAPQHIDYSSLPSYVNDL
jgi:hypothetical protein